jgi:hypothetical protein
MILPRLAPSASEWQIRAAVPRLGQQQVRHVGASDEQHQRHHREKRD